MRHRWLLAGLATVSPVLLLIAPTAGAAQVVGNDADESIPVELTGDGATGPQGYVSVDGRVVTLTAAATYRVSGKLTGGQIVVDTSDTGTVEVVLDNAEVSSTAIAALAVRKAGSVVVSLASGTHNTLTSTEAQDLVDGQPSAVLYSEANLKITGPGELVVDAASGDGIDSRGGLVVDSGTIAVTAPRNGMRGKDRLLVSGGAVTVTAGGDGMKSTREGQQGLGYVAFDGGKVQVTSGKDGISAATDLLIHAGDLTVTSGGGVGTPRGTGPDGKEISAKGAKSHGGSTTIDGGTLRVNSADDGVNSAFDVNVAGGTLVIDASDDGIHADNALNISDGSITLEQAREGLDALKFTMTGGDAVVNATNDGVNSAEKGLNEFTASTNAFIHITGGSLWIASGDDGIDSNGSAAIEGGAITINPKYDGIDTNGSLTLSGGVVVINGNETSNMGQDGLEILGTLTFSGGTLLAAGAAATFRAPPANTPQAWAYGKFTSKLPAGTVVQLVVDGNVVMSYRAPRDMQSLLFTSNTIVAGGSYEVYVGGTPSGDPIDGLYPGGDAGSATFYGTLTADKYSTGLAPVTPPESRHQ